MPVITAKPNSQKRKSEIPAMKKAAKGLVENPQEARKILIRGGFMTQNGKLTKRYGG